MSKLFCMGCIMIGSKAEEPGKLALPPGPHIQDPVHRQEALILNGKKNALAGSWCACD